MLKKITIIYERFLKGVTFFTGIIALLTVPVVSTEVFLRYFMNRPTDWAVPVTQISMLFIVLLGAPGLIGIDRHIKIDLVVARFDVRRKAQFDAIVSLISAVVALVLACFGATCVWDAIVTGMPIVAAIDIPKSIPLSAITIGFLLMFIELLRKSSRAFQKWRTSKSN